MERAVILWDHFFECLFWLIRISSSGEFVSMMNAANDEFLIHSYGEDRLALFEFLIPFVIGIGVGQTECVACT